MTRSRALKTIIRARAARTGERYTTARRHVLKQLESRTAAILPHPSAPETVIVRPGESPDVSPPSPARRDTPAAAAGAVKGAISDQKCREKTGHGLEHWFEVLDRFGAVEKGHTQAARHLSDVHHVDGWYAQGITVSYERARGVRAVNQRCDGEFEVSVSKVVAGGVQDVITALADPRVRKRWAAGIDGGLVKALAAALGDPRSETVVVRPDGLGRFRYKWGDTTVQFYLQPKGGGKVSLVVTNSKLADAGMVEARRTLWRAALQALADTIHGKSRK